MSALANALDIPDEPPRQWRGVPAALIGAAVALAAGVVIARTLALGGWVRPWLAIQAVVAIPAMIVAWALAGPHRFRTWITAGVMAVALVLMPVASAGATPSPARLSQIVEGYGLPGESVREIRIGNGRCRPACSELRRTSMARGIAFAKVRAQVEGILRARGFEVRKYGHAVGAPLRIDAVKDDVRASFELRAVDLVQTRIAAVWIAHGPTPAHEVG